MFVPEAFRGQGVGRALAERIVAEAKEAGYRAMRLDTSRRQDEAVRLYESMGFRRIAPYYATTDDVKDWLIFFELALP
jgi:ribosomal protein S18 acetylase RimI-like enzyme